ncbi:DNA-binding protein [Bradyrhizobium sp. GM24.11]
MKFATSPGGCCKPNHGYLRSFHLNAEANEVITAIRKRNVASPVDDGEDDRLSVLERQLAKIEADDKALFEVQLSLEENSGGVGSTSRLTEAARALLDGSDYDPNANSISQLEMVRKKRAVSRRAMEIGCIDRDRLLIERAEKIFASFSVDVAEIERRRIMAALELQGINRQRERLREKIRSAGGGGSLPSDGRDLLGLGESYDEEVNWCVERIIASGVATRAEIERARSSND